MRNIQFANGEYYHIYNRGVDRRRITLSEYDSDRFIASLIAFNNTANIGSLYEISFSKPQASNSSKLVNIIAYCLNPNHFHLILEQLTNRGISLLLKRLSGGYSYYFNLKHGRSGTLFQGPFKAKHIADNDYLLHLCSYVSLNDKVHQLGYQVTKLVRSSAREYFKPTTRSAGICTKDIVMDQFKNSADFGVKEKY